MANATRLPLIRLLVLGALLSVATCWAQKPPIVEQIAKTYGLDSFSQIDAIRYTFNAGVTKAELSRSWVWEPKTGRVTFEGKDKAGKPVKVTYLRSQMGSEPANVKDEIDPEFINDEYWLVFPFHLVWDTDPKIEDTGMHKLPLGKGSATRLVMTYPAAAGGYQPGDIWELFIGPDNRIKEWVYHRAGSPQPTVITTWADYKQAGPLLVALDHRGTRLGKPARVYFTDVSVKLAGSDNWMSAK
jgi:hypothetical protein